MTTVIVDADCGNSPKNIFLKNLSIAFAKCDRQFILDSVTEDIRWNIVGDVLIEGKEAFAEALAKIEDDRVEELTIRNVVTHGKAGAVNGTTKSKQGQTSAFCEVYEFSNSKGTHVREITSYIIEAS